LKTFPILIVLFLYTINCFAQEEYMVTNENDTIYGEISRSLNLLNTAKVGYKIKSADGRKSRIDPAKIKFIRSLDGVDGDCIIAPIYDEWFVKRILDGRIKVYQLVDGIVFFTSKDDSDIILNDFGGLNNREDSMDRIRPLIEDNSVILQEFNSLKGSQRDIIYIIEKYNKLNARFYISYY